MSGNLVIIESGAESSNKDPVVTRQKEEFNEREAIIILYFFKKELEEIGCMANITREPDGPGPTKTLRVEYNEEKAGKVKPALSDLRKKISSIVERKVQIPSLKKRELADFEKEYKDHLDILIIPDIANNSVEIVGKTKGSVEDATQKLKLKLGILQTPDSRTNYQDSGSRGNTATYAGIVSGGSHEKESEKSNIERYRKGKRFHSSPSNSRSGNEPGSSNRGTTSPSRSRSYGAAAADDDFNFTTELSNGFILKVYKASITRLDVNVIVNAANDTMMHGGGVARVISEAAGYDLDDESKNHVDRNGLVKVGENIVTTAGRLPYEAVIHAVGPMWHDYRDKVRCLDDLYDCVYGILQTCRKKAFKTVAMSAISAGIFAVPKSLCADMYVRAASDFSTTLKPSEYPRELHIIDIDTQILQDVQDSLKRWQKDPKSVDQRRTIPEYMKANPHAAGYSSSGGGGGGHRSYRRHRNPRHGGGGWNSEMYHSDGVHGSESRSTGDVPNEGQPLILACKVKKIKDENFKWGGVGKLFVLGQQTTVKIYQGEISKVRSMDAIVCGTGNDLKIRGFIAEALLKAGGDQYKKNYDKMLKKHPPSSINPFDVFKCEGGVNLGAKFVLHAVVRRVVDANEKEIQEYQRCIKNVLQKVKRNDLRKVAIPMLGTGTIQTNTRKLKLCAMALLKALDDYFDKFGDKNEITEIHLVNNKKEVTDILEEVFNEAAGCRRNTGSSKSKNDRDGNKVKGRHSNGGETDAGRQDGQHSSRGRRTYTSNGMETRPTYEKERSHNKTSGNESSHEYDQIRDDPNDELDSSDSDHYEKIGSIPDNPPTVEIPDSQKQEKQRGNLMIIDS